MFFFLENDLGKGGMSSWKSHQHEVQGERMKRSAELGCFVGLIRIFRVKVLGGSYIYLSNEKNLVV